MYPILVRSSLAEARDVGVPPAIIFNFQFSIFNFQFVVIPPAIMFNV